MVDLDKRVNSTFQFVDDTKREVEKAVQKGNNTAEISLAYSLRLDPRQIRFRLASKIQINSAWMKL